MRAVWRASVIFLAICLTSLPGQMPDAILPPKAKVVGPPALPEDIRITPHPTLDSGVAVAAQDALLTLINFDAPAAYRYIWIDNTDDESRQAVMLTLNYISRSSFLYRPNFLPCPGGIIVKVDARVIFPKEADLIEGVRTWEEFRFDPASSLLLTKDFLELNHIAPELLPQVPKHGARKEKRPQPDGTEVEVLVPFEELAPVNADVVRLDAPDIDPVAFRNLKALTQSEAPVTEWRYWIFRALSTIKDDGPYKTIFGGLYSDLAGIHKATEEQRKKGITDLDVVLNDFGIGNLTGNEKFADFFNRIRGDLLPTTFISDVTGHPRAVVLTHTPAEREGGSFGGFTLDTKRKSIDVRQHVALSQLNPRIDAIELILTRHNGMPLGAVYQGFDDKGIFQGKLLEKADSDVACDRTVPSPYSTDLQAWIGCARCHGPHEVWQPLKDQLATLIESGRIVPIADASKLNDLASDTQDRILGLHSVMPGFPPGRRPRQDRILDKLLGRQRDDFVSNVMELTGEWKGLAGKQTEVGKAANQKIADIYNAYIYAPVTAQDALRDIGLNVPSSQAADILGKLLPPGAGDTVLGIIPEDAILAELTVPAVKENGVEVVPSGRVGRIDWSLRRSFGAGRVQSAVREMMKGQKP